MKFLVITCISLLGIAIASCSDSSTETTKTIVVPSDSLFVMSPTGLRFDGSSTKIIVPDAEDLFLSDGSYTIEAWVKVGSLTNWFQDIIVKSTTTPDLDYLIDINARNQFAFQANGLDIDISDGSTVIEPGKYYHVAGVYDAAANKGMLYVNGVQTASTSTTGQQHQVGNRLLIGANNTEGLPEDQNWNGIIYNVSLWSVAKSPVEVKESMYQRIKGDESGLVACWYLNEGSGTIVNDITGKHNGTISGKVQWIQMPD